MLKFAFSRKGLTAVFKTLLIIADHMVPQYEYHRFCDFLDPSSVLSSLVFIFVPVPDEN